MYKRDTFFQNVKNHLPNNKVSYLQRPESAGTPNLITFKKLVTQIPPPKFNAENVTHVTHT
jgi:hypothetical protein